jgi:hypothetical protein
MKTKERYREFCESESTLPIFSQAFWLDAVCGDAWDVCLVEKDNQIVAAMPYHFRNICGQLVISHPPLTQTLGPWVHTSAVKYANKLGQEKILLTELIRQLPKFAHFHQNWNHINTNWLPFYWGGFQQTTRYTYRLPDLTDLDLIWAGFRENIRTDIRKANNRLALTVKEDSDLHDFLELSSKTFERQELKLPYSKELVYRIDEACAKNKKKNIFIAEDPDGRQHSGVYVIWDEQSAYYLMGGGDANLRTSGATSLCLWEAIKFASTVTKSFDFEGSMIESIERFFRAFGAIQTPYFSVQKTPSSMLKFIQFSRKHWFVNKKL